MLDKKADAGVSASSRAVSLGKKPAEESKIDIQARDVKKVYDKESIGILVRDVEQAFKKDLARGSVRTLRDDLKEDRSQISSSMSMEGNVFLDESFSFSSKEIVVRTSESSIKFSASAAPCTAGFVDCDYGNLSSNSTISCAAECGENCCVGASSCRVFTGTVCKDGVSCMGVFACYGATIPSVVGSCNGERACYEAGFRGRVGSMHSSCLDDYACNRLGVVGSVGNLNQACNGKYGACENAGHGGNMGDITRSCNNERACNSAGSFFKYGGGTGGITTNLVDCCNAAFECQKANETSIPVNCRVVSLLVLIIRHIIMSTHLLKYYTSLKTKAPSSKPTSSSKAAKNAKKQKAGKKLSLT